MLWAATILESTADKFKPCFSSSSVIALTHLSEEVLEAHKALVAQCANRKLEIWRKQDERTGWVPPMPVASAAASLVSLGTQLGHSWAGPGDAQPPLLLHLCSCEGPYAENPTAAHISLFWQFEGWGEIIKYKPRAAQVSFLGASRCWDRGRGRCASEMRA